MKPLLPLTLLSAALASVPTAAQAPVAAAQRSVLTVNAQGAFAQTEHGTAALSSSELKNTSPGLVWQHADGGLAWIATAVSIGNRGTQVFADLDQNNQRAELYSCFDANPANAVWTDLSPAGTTGHATASADATSTKVTLNQIPFGGNPATREVVLRKYSSDSATPDWSYTFPSLVNDSSQVAISRSGAIIVAGIHPVGLDQFVFATFTQGSGTPIVSTTVNVPPNSSLRRMDLSADGSTLYYTTGTAAHIFDIAQQADVFSTNIGASFESHALSGDGSVFAFGNFNTLTIFKKVGGSYSNWYTETVSGSCYCAMIDISDDSSTVASAWTFYNNYLKVRVEAIDVASKTNTMVATLTGTGAKQCIPSDVAISGDGQRIAVGTWGDAGNLVPECLLYRRDSSTPVAQLNLPGSVFDVDISADGDRAVFGSKGTHANDFGNGGRVVLLTGGNEDLALRNVPHIGSSVDVDCYGPVGNAVVLAVSGAELPSPLPLPGIGTLYVDVGVVYLAGLGALPAAGVISSSWPIPATASLIGQSFYFQAVNAPPIALSKDYVKLTFLP